MASERRGAADRPPHVVVIPVPIPGHLHPLLQLSVRLASLGSAITVIATSSTHRASLAALDLFCGGDDNLRQAIRFRCLADGNGGEGRPYGLRESIEVMADSVDDIESLLVSSAQELGAVSLGIIDFFVFQKLRGLASLQGATTAAFWTSSAAMLHLVANIETLLDMAFLPHSKNSGSPEKAAVDSSTIPGLPCQLSVFADIPGDPLDPSFNSMKEIKNSLLEAPVLLLNTLDDVEEQSLRALREQGFHNLVNIGPLLPPPRSPIGHSGLDQETREWLDVQEPSSVLFVSFGTMLELPDEQVMEVGYGLEASQQKFLWVLRETCQRKVAKDLESLTQRTGTIGLIVSWSSQIDVLRHPSVGGFLTHCGWNSTLESLSSGVPMIGWPSMGDQLINCKFMVDVWHVGLRIRSRSSSFDQDHRLVHRSEVEQASRSLMTAGDDLRKRAKMVENKVERAMEVARLRLGELSCHKK